VPTPVKGVHRNGRGHDVLVGIEDVSGSPRDDTVIGDAGPNRIFGGLGDDHLEGLAGKDHLDGFLGVDFLDGGPQRDVCRRGQTNVNCEIIKSQ
jgi:Ca2+-binding RTX toxin-like protein